MNEKVDFTAIPAEILADIRKRAKVEWPDDREWQEDFITVETKGYAAFQAMDFSEAALVRDDIITQAMECFESWEERASHAETEIDAYAEIAMTAPNDIPADVINKMKQDIATEADWFAMQLDSLRGAIDGYRYVRDIREKVGPIRELLVRMEGIIGKECYNGNIQNYSSWGEWEGEGRSFRYPVTFIQNGAEVKRRTSYSDLAHEELVTGYYKFGANELSIYRALMQIIDMLETEYGFVRPEARD
ncbi:hypothetical protein H7F50_02715 [Novosphingobium flavum]|uniref:hypothetical protein n=1 Tax=Novosphingobium aerophilum TaxID=2839843 RepID=UPI00163B0407|nr:hypothetical protein [Novosphingobium aerophilum]MBC2660649.1 hypothetical protein [Novosphingobium aerophilum]